MSTKISNTQMKIIQIVNTAPDLSPFKFVPTASMVGLTTVNLPDNYKGYKVKDVYRNGLLLSSPEDYTHNLDSNSITFVPDNASELGDIFIFKFS